MGRAAGGLADRGAQRTCGGGGGGRSGPAATARRATAARSRSWSWVWRRSWAGGGSRDRERVEQARRATGPGRKPPPQERAAVAGLAAARRAGSHTPQQDEEGFWWRTIIELHAVPQLPAELLQEAVRPARRLAGPRAPQNAARTRRNLTAILRRARLTQRAEARSGRSQRRRELARDAERQRVRALVAASLADAARTHVTHPFGASTTSRSSLEEVSQDETPNRRLTGARAAVLRDRHRPPNVNDRQRERTGPGPGRSFAGLSTTRSRAVGSSEPTRSGRRSCARRHGALSS